MLGLIITSIKLFLYVFIVFLSSQSHCLSSVQDDPYVGTYTKEFLMPNVRPTKDDQYLCTGIKLNATIDQWVLRYDPLASANRAHHMLLYGCSGIKQEFLDAGHWDCGHHGVCSKNKIMYAWAKNAPSTNLPNDVGYRIAGDSGINYLTLQIHYAHALPEGTTDSSGLKLTITHKPQKYKAGMYLMLTGLLDIPPLTPKTHADINCEVGKAETDSINIFAFRTHAHALGSVISGYKFDPKTDKLTEIVKGNPQWPQAFYPMKKVLKVRTDEILHARCTFNSTTRNRHTFIGSTAADEMCNLYLMYYTNREKGTDSGLCYGEHFSEITRMLPASSDEPLPPNPLLEKMTKGINVNKDKVISYSANSSLDSPFDALAGQQSSIEEPKNYERTILMPGVTPKENDSYLCVAVPLNRSQDEWVLGFDPLASANRAHHMLLFGCSDVDVSHQNSEYWDCGHHGVCDGGATMYAWAKNAPPTHLPEGVGFHIAGQTGVNYLVLQIHYAKALAPGTKDRSGLKMMLSTQSQRYKAGIFLLAASFVDIPPHTKITHADVNCQAGSSEPTDINVFAYRVHAHKLATVITGYKYNTETYELIEIAKGNPQWPQAFYPLPSPLTITPRELIHARCTYDSTHSDVHTYIGSTSKDEMCNLYLMYYTDAIEGSDSGGCGGETFKTLTAALPPSSDDQLPPNPELEGIAIGENKNKDKETTYHNLSYTNGPIAIEKKTSSRKNPPSSRDYNYPNYEDYEYSQQLRPRVPSSARTWNPSPELFSSPQQFKGGGLPQLKPVPVQSFDDYGTDKNIGTIQYFGQGDQQTESAPPSHVETNLVSSPRTGKNFPPSSVYRLVDSWGPSNYKMGQVTAVAIDSAGDLVVFHRGNVVWDGTSFNGNEVLIDQSNPISEATLLHLHRDTGQVMHQWGANFFYMPHGLTMDKEDNIWITDVGMHQVFKFPPGYGEGKPLISLGKKLEPGNDDHHFCKPTSVAVLKNGEFFVADGYCNARIIRFSSDGKKVLSQFGEQSSTVFGLNIGTPADGSFFVPHSLTLVDDHNEICVADRENGRVQCFDIDTGKFERNFKFEEWGNRVFAVAYTPHFGGRLLVVNGPQMFLSKKIQVFEVSYTDNKLINSFSPFNKGLSNPHDLTMTPDGSELYVAEIGPNKVWKFSAGTKSQNSNGGPNPDAEVKTSQLKQGSPTKIALVPHYWTSVGISSVVVGLVSVPILVLATLAFIIRCRNNGSKKHYLENNKCIKKKNGIGLTLGSLLNKRHGFEQVATNDLDEDELESGDSDVEEFSLSATKV